MYVLASISQLMCRVWCMPYAAACQTARRPSIIGEGKRDLKYKENKKNYVKIQKNTVMLKKVSLRFFP